MSSSFSIKAASGTDIWRKPPSTNVFNAPTGHASVGSLSNFQRARLTVQLPPLDTLTLYDQGGLLLTFRRASNSAAAGHAAATDDNSRWLKTGIEIYQGRPWLACVGCDRWADWSISPLEGDHARDPRATVEVERSRDENGKGLWVYAIVGEGDGERRVPVREVCWALAGEEGWEVEVCAYAARPKGEGSGEVEVGFEGLVVEWR